MATGAQATERVAEVARLLPSFVFRVARSMREHDPRLWPQATRGGGKGAAHVQPAHLTNLALALAASDTIAASPKVVRGYRAMIADNPAAHVPDPDHAGEAASLLAYVFNGERSLGAGMDRVVELMTNERAAKTLEMAGLHIELCMDRIPRAYVAFHTFDSAEDDDKPFTKWLYRRRHPAASVVDPDWNFLPPPLITRTASIPASLLTVMATLWSDTKQRLPAPRTKHLTPTASATADSEQENAATLPQAAASRLNQPSTESERPGRQTSRKVGERDTLAKRRRSVAALNEE
jgi:hypothetical protein